MILKPKALSQEAFAAYGDVIEVTGDAIDINEGFTQRFDDLARVDVSSEAGHGLISIFRSTPKPFPIVVSTMERHPLGSQAFMPLASRPFLVLVAAADSSELSAEDLELFVSNGKQGVNYHKNVWHHYCLALEQVTDFLVVDRGGPGNNLEEISLAGQTIHIEDVHKAQGKH